jgi:hypothetical protein
MELNLLTESGVRALLNAGMIDFVDDIPQIDPNILTRLDAGDTVREAIRFVTTPEMWLFRCPGCDHEVKAIKGTSLVMHYCPKSKPKKNELRNLKRIKEA